MNFAMKTLLFCAAVLFPYTFWIIIRILPNKIEHHTHQIDMCLILKENEIMNHRSQNAILSLARKVE